MSGILVDEPLDEIDLLQGDLNGVLVLGTTGGVGNPELHHGENGTHFIIGCTVMYCGLFLYNLFLEAGFKVLFYKQMIYVFARGKVFRR